MHFYKKKNYLHFIKKNCLGPTYKKTKPRKSAFIKKVLKLIETPDMTSHVSPLRLLLLEPCVLFHGGCQLCLPLAVRKHNIDFEVGMEDLEQELSLYNYIDQAPVRALHRSFLIGVSPLPPPPCGSCRGQRLLELLGAWNLEEENSSGETIRHGMDLSICPVRE